MAFIYLFFKLGLDFLPKIPFLKTINSVETSDLSL